MIITIGRKWLLSHIINPIFVHNKKKYICMSFHSLEIILRNGTIFTFDLRCAIVSGRREQWFWQCYQDFAVFHNPSNFRPLITQQNRVWYRYKLFPSHQRGKRYSYNGSSPLNQIEGLQDCLVSLLALYNCQSFAFIHERSRDLCIFIKSFSYDSKSRSSKWKEPSDFWNEIRLFSIMLFNNSLVLYG